MIVREGVGDRLQSVHEANLFDLAAKTAELRSIVEINTYFEGVAS